MEQQNIKATFKGKPYIVTIDEQGVSVSPEGPDGGPDLNGGLCAWVDMYLIEHGELLVHTYIESSDEPVTIRAKSDRATVQMPMSWKPVE